jgi:hypothetical protein
VRTPDPDLPLEEIVEAHRVMESGQALGKMTVTVD